MVKLYADGHKEGVFAPFFVFFIFFGYRILENKPKNFPLAHIVR